MQHGQKSIDALVKPIDNAVLPPKTNPLDEGVLLQTANQNSLSADDTSEDNTTPEASLSHVELESPDSDFNLDADTTSDDEEGSPSQSTLSGSTFHTTHVSDHYADSDESQQWQITQTERGTGTLEH